MKTKIIYAFAFVLLTALLTWTFSKSQFFSGQAAQLSSASAHDEAVEKKQAVTENASAASKDAVTPTEPNQAPQATTATRPPPTSPTGSAEDSTANLPEPQRSLARLNAASKQPWTVKTSGLHEKIRTLTESEWAASQSDSTLSQSKEFVDQYASGLFGVPPEQLKLKEISDGARTRIVYEQEISGWLVYGATLSLFFEGGHLTRVQSDLETPEGRLGKLPDKLAMQDVFAMYLESRGLSDPARTKLKVASGTRTVLFPSPQALVPAYEFTISEKKPDAKASAAGGEDDPINRKSYRVIFDAAEKRVIKKWSSQVN